MPASERASARGSRSEEGLQLLTDQMDFEFRVEGEELGGEGGSWSGYCLHFGQAPEQLGQHPKGREKKRRWEREKRKKAAKVKAFRTSFVSFLLQRFLSGGASLCEGGGGCRVWRGQRRLEI